MSKELCLVSCSGGFEDFKGEPETDSREHDIELFKYLESIGEKENEQ